ncbi:MULTISPECIES: response regulator transcription factor [Aerococcus]|uniref:DNA-binding response regulator n=2 Tax=Aerococcus TaxID=1375 RepID=A0A178HCK0_9LACT|nr:MULTISPECIES: response regulator transcription factor [Aerococcus]KAA9220407.1 response regulator transcription factor [Aerococcus loyolae]KAA9265539.1 response regulator transcription factor [Aerococcus loyolae]MCY3026320.1 response regulator transcription factor [Aerococcus loyolae]MCY3027252.1 response regulator transcription factor [Aerococcus loyolae]MCY3028874.1 response regulator transcription factor [Aerococcus loyolae]
MKILLLDDHHLFGQSLKHLFEDQMEIEVCDYVDSPVALFHSLKIKTYDLLLIDINLKADLTGFDVIRKLKKDGYSLPIVVLTAYDLANYQSLGYELGVRDFINKSIEINDLVQRLQTAVHKTKIQDRPFIIDPLTSREIEILQKLVQGQTKKDVASELFISERTLYNHLTNIYSKLDATNLIEAYNKAMKIGYIVPKM